MRWTKATKAIAHRTACDAKAVRRDEFSIESTPGEPWVKKFLLGLLVFREVSLLTMLTMRSGQGVLKGTAWAEGADTSTARAGIIGHSMHDCQKCNPRC